MGILDLVNNYSDTKDFLDKQKTLGEDLLALKRTAENWENNKPLDVGESGTIYRFVRFYLWKNNIKREIIRQGTLKTRKICDNSEIVNWPPEKLLELDNKTSQWASMAYLLGDRKKILDPPFKLKITYDSVEHWDKQREEGKSWEARLDETIYRQALAFVSLLKTGKIMFKPKQAEDYCFARAFNIIDAETGKRLFPSLIGHETNRIEEMEKAMAQMDTNEEVTSADHRIVQAIAMKSITEKKQANILNKQAVNKTWPKFWEFMDYCKKHFRNL